MAGIGIKGRKVIVVGVNASGNSLVRFLLKKAALVTLVDSRDAETVNSLISEDLDKSRFLLEAGDYNPKTFEESHLIILTPGTPRDIKALEGARALAVPIVSELEFVSSYVEEPLIAVGGTNGKSTTAALLAKILEYSGKNIFVNIDLPLAEYLNRSKPADYVIGVLNPVQLEAIHNFKAEMVLLLNLTEDYAQRYISFDNYLAVQKEILKNANEETKIIFNLTDPHVSSFVPVMPGKKGVFGATSPFPDESIPAAWADKSTLNVRVEGVEHAYLIKNFRLRGQHNRENLMAASLAASILGAKPEAIKSVIESFSALPHRVEFVRRINSVAFYNDSCAANVQAVLRSLQAFHEPVILIAGGRDKNSDYSPLIPHIRQKVKNLILVGEAKEKFNRAVGDFTETFLVGTIEEAVLVAYQKSRSGDVILLSPACDSSDMFASPEERGEHFKKLVSLIAQPRRPNVI